MVKRTSIAILLASAAVALGSVTDARAELVIDVTETTFADIGYPRVEYSSGYLWVRHRDYGGMNAVTMAQIDLSPVDAYLAAHPGAQVSGASLTFDLYLNEAPAPQNYWFRYAWDSPIGADAWNPRTISQLGDFPYALTWYQWGTETVDLAAFSMTGSESIGSSFSFSTDALRDVVANDPNRIISMEFSANEATTAGAWYNRAFNNLQLHVRFSGGVNAVPEPAGMIQAATGLALLATAASLCRRARRR